MVFSSKYKFYVTVLMSLAMLASDSLAYADDIFDWDTYSDTWVAVDELQRTVSSSATGIVEPRANRTVGMFYYICNGPHGTNGQPIYDITEILKANPKNPEWGPEGSPHWWAKPWLGYYVNSDAFVYDKHLQMLTDAGIDFLFFDVTNAFTYDSAVLELMKAIDRRTEAGMKSPKLCYTVNASAATVVKNLWNKFYSKPEYDKYWFYYDGRPLMLVNKSELSSLDSEIVDHFTMRYSWAWMQGRYADQWAWLEYYPQKMGWTMKNGVKTYEQISVSTAQHATTKVGKSYHNGSQPQIDEYSVCKETPQGLYFAEQWKQAHLQAPPIVMVTQFNECMAGRFVIKSTSEYGNIYPGGTPAIGGTYFVDAFNAEFNRDIEPSTHPLIRDNYYMQLVDNVRRYKGVREIPVPSAAKTIELNSDMSQWDDVTPEFRDDIGDITHRNTQGFQNMAPMVNETGRHDLVASKVTKDADNVYFYLRMASTPTNIRFAKTWIMLFINADCDYTTGWNGYDYVTMKKSGSEYWLYRNEGNAYSWTEVAKINLCQDGNQLYFALSRADLGMTTDCDFDFKWADNIPDNPDILDFIDKGDVAPNGRFNYRYRGSLVPQGGVKTVSVANDVKWTRLASGEVSLRWSSDDVTSVEIYNAQGALIQTNPIADNAKNVVLNLPKGFVIVKVVSKTGLKSLKIA